VTMPSDYLFTQEKTILGNQVVSICIPSYNHARYLPAAIESALAQTYQNTEIIIVDDGSTDESFAIAQKYAAEHPAKIKVYTHPGRKNKGISATSNLGFSKATGEFWGGLPSDDLLLPEKTELQIALLNSHPDIGWCYGYAQKIGEHGRDFPGGALFGEDITQSPFPLHKLIKGNVIPGMTVLARRSVLEEHQIFNREVLLYADWVFWINLLSHAKAGFIDRPLVKYRLHSTNASIGIELIENVRRGLAVMNELRRHALDIGGTLAQPQSRALIELETAYHLFLLGDVDEAGGALAKAFEIDSSLRSGSYFAEWLNERKLYTQVYNISEHEFRRWVLEQLPGAVKSKTDVRRLVLSFAQLQTATDFIGFYDEGLPARATTLVRLLTGHSGRIHKRVLLRSLASKYIKARLVTES